MDEARLTQDTERQQREAQDMLEPLLIALALALLRGKAEAALRLGKLLKQRSSLAFNSAWQKAANLQTRDLVNRALPAELAAAGLLQARAHGELVTESAQTTLQRHVSEIDDEGLQLGYVAPYAALVASLAVYSGVRSGANSSAQYFDARRKKFIRVRRAKDPRAHSRLEGDIIGINEQWNIDGYLVDAPGSAALPWSSRAFCGHIAWFLDAGDRQGSLARVNQNL